MLKKWQHLSWRPRWQALLSAILIVLAFPPWDLSFLIWIALVPWLFSLRDAPSMRERFWQGFWLNYGMNLGGFFWIAYAIHEHGELPMWLGGVCLLIYCAVGELQWIVFSCLFKIGGFAASAFSASLLYSGLDWLMPRLFKDTLGHALYSSQYLRQLADLGGVGCLTFLIFLINYTFFLILSEYLVKRKPNFSKQTLRSSLLVLGILVGGWTYGAFRFHEINQMIENKSTTHVQAAGIQANIGDFVKLSSERGLYWAVRKVIDTFAVMSEEAMSLVQRPEFLVWPETAYPSAFRSPESSIQREMNRAVMNLSERIQTPLLFGAYDEEGPLTFNSFFFLEPGKLPLVYRKHTMLLFAEYIPGASRFKFLRDLLPQVGNFGTGKGASVLSVNLSARRAHPAFKLLITPLICYEVLSSEYVIESARQGSQLIVNITNDSWFGNWGEPQLHQALSIFRSIESRQSLLRITNTGISALILPTGAIQSTTQNGVREILNVSIPILFDRPTLVKLLGDWFGKFAAMLSLGLGIVYWRRGTKFHSPT